jgi:alpha-L-fucosidase
MTKRDIYSAISLPMLLLALRSLEAPAAAPPSSNAPPHPYPARLEWWTEGRFGMFIHWGPVSLQGTEISWSRANSNPKCPNQGTIPVAEYDNLYRRFNPTNFNAREWVALARSAGIKYMVLTAKHCDGFLLWDSKVDDYNIMHTPFKRDVCRELAQAAHDAGMRLGWYFSPMDWRDPDCRNEKNAEFVKRFQAELRELLTNYGRIDLLWFDYDGRPSPWDQETTYALVKKLQPQIVINNRLDLSTQEAGDPKNIGPQADYCTPEQWIGGYDTQHPWESCMTLSARNQWAWGGAEDGVKSIETCLEMLIRCAGGDGNVLLNVGPMPTGEIAPEQAARLKAMGEWLQKNGESIQGTRGGPFRPGEYGVSTRKGNVTYLHIMDWSEDPLKLPVIPAKILQSRLLSGGEVTVLQNADGIAVSVPENARQAIDTVVALELDSPALRLDSFDVPGTVSLAKGAKATASNVYQGQAEFGADKAVDGRTDTRWATDTETTSAWLEVDLGKPVSFSRATLKQAYPELKRIRRFAIEYYQAGQWKSCYRGENPGAKTAVKFNPVSAQRVRLNLIDAADGPTVWEFQIFN